MSDIAKRREQMKVWIDPPSGWKYGFPKIYDPDCGLNVMEWLVKEGYPQKEIGAVWHKALDSSVWTSKIYTEDFPFTNESEKFLGHFIDEYSAKKSVELFWLKEYNTLITSN